MVDTTTNPTRRAMLAAAPVFALIGAVPGCIRQAKASTTSSSAITKLIAEYREVVRIADAFNAAYEPVRKQWIAERDAVRAAMPHATQDMGKNIYADDVTWTTEKPWLINSARRVTGGNIVRFDDPEQGAEYTRRAAAFLKAAERRERAIEAAEARVRAKYSIDALYSRSLELDEAVCAAVDRVAHYPAATGADLLAKVQFMREVRAFDWDAAPDLIVADVRRLLDGEA